jgi:hypothetical protein
MDAPLSDIRCYDSLLRLQSMSTDATNSNLFCDLDALSVAERQRRHELAAAVARAVRKITEMNDGYAVTIDARKITVGAIDEWIALEKRCCAFLNFRVNSAEQALTVEMTGEAGVKEFLRAEFSR